MEQDQLREILVFEDYMGPQYIARGISDHFEVSMRVGCDAALDFKARGTMTCEELVHSINQAIVRESLSKLVDQGHAQLVINQKGEVEYLPVIRKRPKTASSIQNE